MFVHLIILVWLTFVVYADMSLSVTPARTVTDIADSKKVKALAQTAIDYLNGHPRHGSHYQLVMVHSVKKVETSREPLLTYVFELVVKASYFKSKPELEILTVELKHFANGDAKNNNAKIIDIEELKNGELLNHDSHILPMN